MTKHGPAVLILTSLSILGDVYPVYTRIWVTDDGSATCGHCGHKLPKNKHNDNRFCQGCGRLIMDAEESDEDVAEAAIFLPEITVRAAEELFRRQVRNVHSEG